MVPRILGEEVGGPHIISLCEVRDWRPHGGISVRRSLVLGVRIMKHHVLVVGMTQVLVEERPHVVVKRMSQILVEGRHHVLGEGRPQVLVEGRLHVLVEERPQVLGVGRGISCDILLMSLGRVGGGSVYRIGHCDILF